MNIRINIIFACLSATIFALCLLASHILVDSHASVSSIHDFHRIHTQYHEPMYNDEFTDDALPLLEDAISTSNFYFLTFSFTSSL